MFKKFINGLVFGAGFAVAFILIFYLSLRFLFPIKYTAQNEVANNDLLLEPPTLAKKKGFLGSTSTISGGLDFKEQLAPGDGVIRGKVETHTGFSEGLKLRLALNSSVWSSWGITDELGEYIISVPNGEYEIHGYELDYESANKTLPNQILKPGSIIVTSPFNVTKEQEGTGLHLEFVEPVVKFSNKTKYNPHENVLLSWKEYPGAFEYSIQVFEKEGRDSWKRNALFSWHNEIKTHELMVNLNDYVNTLNTNTYYSFTVKAFDDKSGILSESVMDLHGYDFYVKEKE